MNHDACWRCFTAFPFSWCYPCKELQYRHEFSFRRPPRFTQHHDSRQPRPTCHANRMRRGRHHLAVRSRSRLSFLTAKTLSIRAWRSSMRSCSSFSIFSIAFLGFERGMHGGTNQNKNRNTHRQILSKFVLATAMPAARHEE